MLCIYKERKAVLPRSLSSSPSHNIEGGNKNNGTHSTGLLTFCMCIHGECIKITICQFFINDPSTSHLKAHFSLHGCVIFSLRVGWGWKIGLKLDLKSKCYSKCLTEAATDLVQTLHGGPGLVLDAVPQGGGVVPGRHAANTQQAQQWPGHPWLWR